MAERDSIPNHTIDPATGMIESNGYGLAAFNAKRKLEFLELYMSSGLELYKTCETMGLSHSTVSKHYKIDPEFMRRVDELRKVYLDKLEGVSRRQALEPKCTLERIFQLKALAPDKYSDAKRDAPSTSVTINIDTAVLEMAKKRENVIEAKIIENQQLSPVMEC